MDKPSDVRAPYNDNVYENDKFIVCDNGSSELIIKLKGVPNVSVRVTPHKPGNISVVSQDRILRMYHINGLNGIITEY